VSETLYMCAVESVLSAFMYLTRSIYICLVKEEMMNILYCIHPKMQACNCFVLWISWDLAVPPKGA